MGGEDLFDKSQLMKGTIEGSILKIISKQKVYGYEILEILKQNGFSEITEGTIYPILLRLENQKYIFSERKPSPIGPYRKYYIISDKGINYLEEFINQWSIIYKTVCKILFGEDLINENIK